MTYVWQLVRASDLRVVASQLPAPGVVPSVLIPLAFDVDALELGLDSAFTFLSLPKNAIRITLTAAGIQCSL